MSLQVINMRYPKELIERIDKYKASKGFTTRTQAIVHLIHSSLEREGF